MNKPYYAAADSAGTSYVAGPNTGSGSDFSYYGGTLSPGSRCESAAAAETAATLCNAAYQAGYEQAQADMRRVMGVKV